MRTNVSFLWHTHQSFTQSESSIYQLIPLTPHLSDWLLVRKKTADGVTWISTIFTNQPRLPCPTLPKRAPRVANEMPLSLFLHIKDASLPGQRISESCFPNRCRQGRYILYAIAISPIRQPIIFRNTLDPSKVSMEYLICHFHGYR